MKNQSDEKQLVVQPEEATHEELDSAYLAGIIPELELAGRALRMADYEQHDKRAKRLEAHAIKLRELIQGRGDAHLLNDVVELDNITSGKELMPGVPITHLGVQFGHPTSRWNRG